ncbi:hypothetical protein MMC25_004265 [Agyrium rufum]|nr:hypothetical protein [Agyrium rufum]
MPVQYGNTILSSPYLDTDMQSRWWEFGGDAIIRSDQSICSTFIRQTLTGGLDLLEATIDGYELAGKVFLMMRTGDNWTKTRNTQLDVEFKIAGQGNLHGDGMALWVTKERAMGGPVFGFIDKFEGLGIFIDTYKNNRPGTQFPYVMAMVGDGQTSYDKDTDGKPNELAGCSARGVRGASVPTKLRLTYFQDESLKLELQYKAEDSWILCFETGPVTIPSVAHLGFSAETGELSDDFDLISVEAKNLYSLSTGENTKSGSSSGSKPSKGRKYDPNKDTQYAGWGWTFIKFVLFLLVIGGGYVGYTMYRTSKRGSRFD